MIIGIPKEIKDYEYRVGVTPAIVRALVEGGHQVKVEMGAGKHVGCLDEDFVRVGATLVSSIKEAYDSEMVIKVKEPQPLEYLLLKEGQIILSFLHLAANPKQVEFLLKKKVVGIAYETVTDFSGKRLPILSPMSEIAGCISIQAGATALQIANGGKGVLLGGLAGVPPAKVVILGAGVSGTQAARMAMGLGADVTVIDINLSRLHYLNEMYGSRLKTVYSTSQSIEEHVLQADLVIGAVLIPGKKAPKLITRKIVKKMSVGSVIVDIAIDQGGCAETSKPTIFSHPRYCVDGVVHYCVSNIPGACARSSTQALANVALPYILKIANHGYKRALRDDKGLLNGLNVCLGSITCEAVASDLGYEFIPPEKFLL